MSAGQPTDRMSDEGFLREFGVGADAAPALGPSVQNPLVPATLRGPTRQMTDEGFYGLWEMQDKENRSPDPDDIAKAYAGQESLVEGDPLPVGGRFWLGLLSDRFDEMEATVEKYMPGVELWEIPETDIVLFRNRAPEGEKQEQWRKVDKGFVEGLANEGAFNEVSSDISEAIGRYGVTLGAETGAAVGAKGFWKSLMRMGGGAGVGETARQGIQTLAGTQRETASEQLIRAGGEAGLSVMGGTVGHNLGRLGEIMTKRRGLFQPTEEGRAALEATQALREFGWDIDDPIPYQLIENPMMKKVGRQSAGITSAIPKKMRALDDALARGLQGMSSQSERQALRDRSEAFVESTGDDLVEGMIAALKFKKTSLGRAAREMQSVAEVWWYSSGRIVDDLYRYARSIEEPQFNLEAVQELARTVLGGKKTVGLPVMQKTGLLDEAGNPITREVTELIDVRNLPKPLVKELEKILRIDPTFPAKEGADAPMDVLRELRRVLSDLALPGPEGARLNEMLAGKLRHAVDQTMKNPTNANPEFLKAYRQADRAAYKRFNARERAAVVELFGLENYDKWANNLAQPLNASKLSDLARAGGKEAINPIRHAFWTRLVENPYNITAELARFDKPTLGILLHPSERRVVEAAARHFDDISQSGLREAIKQQTRARPFIRQLLRRKDTAGIDALARVIERNGGMNGEMGLSIRSAILDELWTSSQTIRKGRRTIDPVLLNKNLDRFEDTGVLDFLHPDERAIIKHAELVTRVSEGAADAGTAMEAASVAAGVRSRRMSAFVILLENVGVGRIMTNKYGRQLIVGMDSPGQDLNLNVFRLMGGIATGLAASSHNPISSENLDRLESMVPIEYREGILQPRMPGVTP